MSSTLARLPYTPLQDLLRGRVSARLDWRAMIAEAQVTPKVRALVESVVTQTRLWRAEQADVADELISHFLEGMDAGLTDSELIEEFGEPQKAAALLRRAKVRSRPRAWHLFRYTLWLVLAFGVFYAGTGVYYYAGKPAPAATYLQQVNQQIVRQVQVAQAWPIYREFLTASGAQRPDSVLGFSAYGPHWPEIARWVDGHEAVIQSVRTAASLPDMGMPIGPGDSESNSSHGNALRPIVDARLANPPIPQLRDLRLLGDVLAFDAKRAREQRDGPRVEGDIAALSGVVSQLARSSPLNVAQLFSLELLARSYDELDRTLVQAPQLLDDAALVRIAQRISGPQTGSDLISFRGQRLFFEDVLKRTFTDDGHGDGRFSPVGWEFSSINLAWQSTLLDPLLVGRADGFLLQPASLLMMGSRKDQLEEYTRLMDMNDAMIRVPLRDVNSDAPYQELRRLQSSATLRWRYAPVLNLTPSFHRPAELAERTLGQRDGLLVGLALEMYHRRNQRYPDKLDQLVPEQLPAIPADRITGSPLKYRLVNGNPLVYSVGADRIDDGGRMPISNGRPDPTAAARWGTFSTIVAGDWVLYPKPRVAESSGDN